MVDTTAPRGPFAQPSPGSGVSAPTGASPAPTATGLSPAAIAALNSLLTQATDPGNIPNLLKRFRHYYGVASAISFRTVTLNPSSAVQIAAANPNRLSLAYQLAAGVLAYEGQSNAVSIPGAGTAGTPGYALPIGGGWTYGPEMTGAIWLISATGGSIVTIKETSSDVPYP